MNENIVVFPIPPRPIDASAERRAEQRGRDLLRLKEIEKLKKSDERGPLFETPRERIDAALITGRMIDDARRKNVTIEDIRARFTPRIDRYRLLPGTHPTSQETIRRAETNLMKRVWGYLDLAAAVAELCGADPADAKIEVLKNTSLWTRNSSNAGNPETDERAEHLALMLREMVQSVIRRENIAGLFRRARKVPGCWDLDLERFWPSVSASCLPDETYENWLAPWDLAPVLPGVTLAQQPHAIFEVPLLLESEDSRLPSGWLLPENTADFAGDEMRVRFELDRQVRLCVAPTTGRDRLGALFEVRSVLRLFLVSGDEEVEFPVYPARSFDLFRRRCGYVRIDDGWRRFRLIGWPEPSDFESWPLFPYADKLLDRDPFDHEWLGWTPVDAQHVAHWLDVNSAYYAGPGGGFREAPGEQWYARPSLAHFVVRDLATDALETALVANVVKISEALDRRESEWRAGAREMTSTLFSIWNQNEQEQDDD